MTVIFAPVEIIPPPFGRWGHGALEVGSVPLAGEISSPFGAWESWRRDANLGPHRGVDIAVPTGTPVRAPAEGVCYGIRVWDRLPFATTKGGNAVWIDHGDGLFSQYNHLDSIAVARGDSIPAGEIIGRSGNTGKSTGPHLHWGVYKMHQNGTVEFLDPLLLSQERVPVRGWKRIQLSYLLSRNQAQAYATADPKRYDLIVD